MAYDPQIDEKEEEKGFADGGDSSTDGSSAPAGSAAPQGQAIGSTVGSAYGPVGSAAGGAVGGLIGNIASQGAQNQAAAAQQAALAQILGVQAPTVAQGTVSPGMQALQGTLNPNMQATAQIGSNALSGVTTDPRLMQAQMNALAQLQQQGQAGLTSAQLASLQGINQQAAGQAQAANAATMQQMAARGMGGSGVELAAKLSNAQNAANMANTQGNQLAAQAQQGALAATAASGQLGGQMQQTQFGQQAQIANAQNAINQFNTANQQNVMGQNTNVQNAAQQANLQAAQNVANTNVGAQNQAQYYNKGLYQQQFQDQLAQAAAAAGQYNTNSGYYQNQASGTRAMGAGVGSGAGNAAASMFNNSASTPSSNSNGSTSSTSVGNPTTYNDSNNYGAAPLTQPSMGSSQGFAHGGEVIQKHLNRNVVGGYAHGGEIGYDVGGIGGFAYGGEPGYSDGVMIPSPHSAADKAAANMELYKRMSMAGYQPPTPAQFDPSKYPSPTNAGISSDAEDAAAAGQEQTANSPAGIAYRAWQKANGYTPDQIPNEPTQNYAKGGEVTDPYQSIPNTQQTIQQILASARMSPAQREQMSLGRMGVTPSQPAVPTYSNSGIPNIMPTNPQPGPIGYSDGGQVNYVPTQNMSHTNPYQSMSSSIPYSKGGQVYNPKGDNYGNMGMADGGQVSPEFAKEYPGIAYDIQTPVGNWTQQARPKDAATITAPSPVRAPASGDINSTEYDPTLDKFINHQTKGMFSGGRADFRNGGHVPGKAQVHGDSPKNDTVHAKLSPQEIVIPRSVAIDGSDEDILNFVHKVRNRHGK